MQAGFLKETYEFKSSGFISVYGSLNAFRPVADRYVIVITGLVEDHAALGTMCSGTKEHGYGMLWKGAPKAKLRVGHRD